jgi:hypothetical protein
LLQDGYSGVGGVVVDTDDHGVRSSGWLEVGLLSEERSGNKCRSEESGDRLCDFRD